MIRKEKGTKLGLLMFGTLLLLFGVFILTINVTLLYQGKHAIKKEVIEGKDNEEIQNPVMEQKKLPLQQSYEAGEEIGRLSIPKLNISIPIYHGTTSKELTKGIGHVIGTALPGENNNSVLTGHRDTVFRQLEEVTHGDLLKVENERVSHTFLVRKVRIVDENDRTVAMPKRRATLTLATCYPFTYVGSAKQRYVLVADLISSTLRRS